MTLSPKACLALATVVAVAHHGHDEPVAAAALVQRYNLPRRALEPMLQHLVRAGVLQSVRGVAGGYRVERRLSAGDVVRAVLPERLPMQPLALFQPVLEQAVRPATEAMLRELDRIAVDDLVRMAEREGISRALEPLLDFTI